MIAFWQEGDEKAFDSLYKRYVGFLVNTAISKVDSIDTARELVQDVFLSVYLRKYELATDYTLKGYLSTALRNKIFNHYKRELNKQQYEKTTAGHMRIVTDHLEDEYDAKELNAMLQEKIKALPEQCRKVFLMSREEQLSYKEIAERLNISPNTVEQHMQKALRILRSSIGGMLLLACWMKNI